MYNQNNYRTFVLILARAILKNQERKSMNKERQIPERSDEELAKEVQNENKNALEILVRKYAPLIYSLTRKNFEKNFSQDLAQDLWVKFIEHTKNYDETKNSSFAGYIKVMLYADRWTILRRHMKNIQRESANLENVEKSTYDRYENIENEETEKIIKKLELTEKQQIFLKHRRENPDAPMREIASKMGISQVAAHKMQKRIQKIFIKAGYKN